MSQHLISKEVAETFADLLQMELAVGKKRIRGNRQCHIDLGEGFRFPMQLRARAAREWKNGDAVLYVQSLGKLRFMFVHAQKKNEVWCWVLNAADLPHDDEKLLSVSKLEYLFDTGAAGFPPLWEAARAKFKVNNTEGTWEPA